MRRTVAASAAASASPGGGPASATVTTRSGALTRGARSHLAGRRLQAHRPRSARRAQRDGGSQASVVQDHGRELRDPVRAERAPQVDGLAAGAAQRDEGDRRHAAAMRATPASVAAAPASWCRAMRSRSTPNASSTVTTG